LIDTTVQEKNITYPTDTKLQKKIIEKCRKIAKKEDIKLRQSYKRILKQLMIDQRSVSIPNEGKKPMQQQCIAKGKEAKKYEYGNKACIVKTKKSGIILGALSFIENVYDGDTLESQLSQVERVTGGHKPKTGIVDRGFR